jgi:hypothetical protein
MGLNRFLRCWYCSIACANILIMGTNTNKFEISENTLAILGTIILIVIIFGAINFTNNIHQYLIQ